MIILFCLLVFFVILVFVFLYSMYLKLDATVNELYDLYYKKEYNFEFINNEEVKKNNVRNIMENIRNVMGIN